MKKYQIEIKGKQIEIIQDDDGKFIKPEYVKEQEQFGTTLKPAYEPIIVARKPFKGSLVDNVIANGVGGINIDECRVGNEVIKGGTMPKMGSGEKGVCNYETVGAERINREDNIGRFPANVILTYDETDFDEVCGGMPDTKSVPEEKNNKHSFKGNKEAFKWGFKNRVGSGYDDSGSASRYFYCAKASKKDRDEGLDLFEEQYQLIDDVDEKIINEIKRLLNL